jgi:hypothetical protein
MRPDETALDAKVEGEVHPSGYEPPKLIFVGNMNDLLAGNASKDQDNGVTICANTGNDVNAGCH